VADRCEAREEPGHQREQTTHLGLLLVPCCERIVSLQ
jgi:hypothetical protein